MKILIAGADGQLARALRVRLQGHEVVAFTRSDLDISSLAGVRAAVESSEPDLVINAAAYNNVDGAEIDANSAFRINAVGPRNLALVTAAHGIPLLHVSTDYVFDGLAGRAYHEFDRTNPDSTYGRSKLAGELAVASLNHQHFIVRTAWLYDCGTRNFPTTMLSLASKQEVRVVSDQFGSPTFVPHLAQALEHLLDTEAYGTYHIAGAGVSSWFQLTHALYGLLGITTQVKPISSAELSRPAKRPPYSPLVTLQDPEILLPDWRVGLAEFADAVRRDRIDAAAIDQSASPARPNREAIR
jgi:dTDP-4-dehydrorhamnose reductase